MKKANLIFFILLINNSSFFSSECHTFGEVNSFLELVQDNFSSKSLNQANFSMIQYGSREIITGAQIKNVSLQIWPTYSQVLSTGNINLFFSNQSQINGSYQVYHAEDGLYLEIEKSNTKYGNPLNNSLLLNDYLLTVSNITYGVFRVEEYYETSILNFFISNGFTKSFYVIANVSGPIIQENLPGDCGLDIRFAFELINDSIIYTRLNSAVFGGFFSIDQGAIGTFIQFEFNLTDIEYPNIEQVQFLPSNPTTEIDVVFIKFWATDNLALDILSVKYELSGRNYTILVTKKDLVFGSPFYIKFGHFPVGTYRIWIYAFDFSSWGNFIYTTPILLCINKGPDISAPEIYAFDQTIIAGDKSAEILWTCLEDNPAYFEIYVNGTLSLNETLKNGTIIVPITALGIKFSQPCKYNLTGIFYDTLSHSTTKQIWLIVKKTSTNLYPFFIVVFTLIVLLLVIVMYIYKSKDKNKMILPESSRLVLFYGILKQIMARYHYITEIIPREKENLENNPELLNQSLINQPDYKFTRSVPQELFKIKIENIYDVPSEELIRDIKDLPLERITDKGLKELIYIASRWPEHVSQSEISDILDFKRPTVSKITKILLEKELVLAKPGLEDTRYLFLRISPQGINLLDQLTKHIEFALKNQYII